MSSYEQRPVRVLHSAILYAVGGVQTLLRSLFKNASTNGIEHHLLIRHDPCHPQLAPDILKYASSVSYVKYWHGLKLPPWPRFLRAHHLQRVLREVRPNVVIVHSSLGNLKSWDSIKSTAAAKIYYEHGQAWTTRDEDVACQFLEEADSVICCSEASRRILELRCGLPSGRAEVLLNPMVMDTAGEQITPKSLDSSRPLRIGVPARLVPVKGLPLAMHAVKHLCDEGINCELHLAGEGIEKESLEALTRRLGLVDKIHFHGVVQDMPDFYRYVDISLCPSLHEAFGIVAVEAGYLGCPVICGVVDGLPEIVVDGHTGFCIPPSLPLEKYAELGGRTDRVPEYVYDVVNDSLMRPKLLEPAHIAEKVRYLYEHPEVFAAMSAAAHQHVAAKFGMGVYVQELDRLIIEALEHKKAVSL